MITELEKLSSPVPCSMPLSHSCTCGQPAYWGLRTSDTSESIYESLVVQRCDDCIVVLAALSTESATWLKPAINDIASRTLSEVYP
jgi:hypothetical protein